MTWKAKVDNVGRLSLKIDGQDVSQDIDGFTVSAAAGEKPEIYVSVLPTFEMTGETEVHLVSAAESLKAVLKQIDGVALCARAFERLGDEIEDPGQAILIELVETLEKLDAS